MAQVASLQPQTRPQPVKQVVFKGRAYLIAPLVTTWAAVLLIFATGGSAAQGVLITYGIIAGILTLESSVGGLAMLIMVATIDGISKGVLPGWFTLLFKDVILWLCIFRWVANRLKGNQSEAARLPTTILLVVFVLWVFVEAANVTTLSPIIALAGIRSWLGWVPVFVIAYDEIKTRHDILVFFMTMIIAAAAVGLYGAIQQHIGYGHLLRISPNFAYTARLGISGGVSRAMSTLPHPGMFGHYMATMMPMALALALAPMLNTRLKLVSLVCAVLITAGAVSSGGRTAAVTLIAAALVVVLAVRQARMVVVGGVVVALLAAVVLEVAAPVSVERMSTISQGHNTLDRVLTPLSRGWQSAVEHPFGLGVATGFAMGRAMSMLGGGSSMGISRASEGMVEGDFGRAFKELGFPGGFLLIYLVLHMIVRGWKALTRTRPTQWQYVGAGLYGVMIAGLLGLLVGPSLYLMPVAALIWLSYAALLRLGQPEPVAEEAAKAATPAVAAG